ncbi:Insulin-like growth factor binding protein, N-terminal [Pseudocohnilembus persalinus]|uniref:Insulin-like growth factor binding protein, N-terminal n=1 Tax=Pseudocohnilembus persalinus TaxID=266149 RepID=A0A0V0QK91_PSEPJ|nr:Insulin-like growth factor binding protein, N-terminal [Pseudocohnilembus persalinus]|eukprot:KRX02691.1 Insulin-like growth factor binding protein, N-terminal [Pseudocohnilembus persalinus]
MKEEYGVTYANLKFNNGNHYANALYTYTRVTDNDHTSAHYQKCMFIQVFTKDGVKISGIYEKCIGFNSYSFYGVELCETNVDNEFAYFYTNSQQNQIKYGFLNNNLQNLRSTGSISKSSQIKYMRARKGDQYIYVAYQESNNLHVAIIKLNGSSSSSKIHDFLIQSTISSNLFTIQAYKNGHAVLLYKKGGNLNKSLIKPDGTHAESQVSGLLYSSISSNLLKNNSEFVDDGGLISVTISGSSSKIQIFTYDMDGKEICFNSQTVSSYDFQYASFTLGSRYEIYIIAKYSNGDSKIITANPMTCSVQNSNYHTNQMYTFGFLYTQSNKQQKIMLFGQGSISGNYYKIFVGTVQSCTDYYTSSCSSCSGSNKSPSNGCRCSTGYFETSFTSCSECTTALRDDLRCKLNQCYSSSLSLCKECIGDQDQEYTRFLGTCDCPIGYYDDFPDEDNCQTCNIRCGDQGCDSATNCIDCVGIQNQPQSRIPNQSCECPVGFWDDSSQLNCQPCNYRCGSQGCTSEFVCKNCIGTSGQSNSRDMNDCKCPVGYYDDYLNNSSNEDCLTCNIRCGDQGCDSATNCLNCVGAQGQVNSRIPSDSCRCPDGFWNDPTKEDCQPCDYRCGNTGCITEFDCKNCLGTSGQSNSRDMNDCKCPVGYYDDYLNNNANEDCLSCNIRCGDQGCDSATNCFNCLGVQGQINSRIPNDSCRCPDGFWNDPAKEDCQPCDYRCGSLGCITEFDCKICLGTSGQLYSRIMSNCICPVGYYDDYLNNNNNEDCLPQQAIQKVIVHYKYYAIIFLFKFLLYNQLVIINVEIWAALAQLNVLIVQEVQVNFLQENQPHVNVQLDTMMIGIIPIIMSAKSVMKDVEIQGVYLMINVQIALVPKIGSIQKKGICVMFVTMGFTMIIPNISIVKNVHITVGITVVKIQIHAMGVVKDFL